MVFIPPEGHLAQRASLTRLFDRHLVPHALLFAGPSGVGKKLVARELCRSLFCEHAEASSYGGCGSCHACRTFDSDNHPDFTSINCLEKEASNVSEIRDLLYSLHLKSFAGSVRAVLLDNAEYLTQATSNALLKTLEEPRPGTFIILVTGNPSRLLPTIVSRCQVLNFERLSNDQVRNILLRAESNKNSDDDEEDENPRMNYIEELVPLADGSLENANRLALHLDSWRDLQRALDKIAAGSLQEAFTTSKELSHDKETLRDKLHLLRVAVRTRMLDATEPGLKTCWANALQNVLAADRLIFERNLSAAYVLNVIFTGIAADAREPSLRTLTNGGILLDRITL